MRSGAGVCDESRKQSQIIQEARSGMLTRHVCRERAFRDKDELVRCCIELGREGCSKRDACSAAADDDHVLNFRHASRFVREQGERCRGRCSVRRNGLAILCPTRAAPVLWSETRSDKDAVRPYANVLTSAFCQPPVSHWQYFFDPCELAIWPTTQTGITALMRSLRLPRVTKTDDKTVKNGVGTSTAGYPWWRSRSQ